MAAWPRWLLAAALAVAAAASPAAAADACCATCLSQTDPNAKTVSYDPVVFSQCSGAKGICCYGCSFSHGNPVYARGVTFDSDGAAQTTVGTAISLSINGVSRVTYDFLAKNQAKTSFVGNQSTAAAAASDGSFSLCARSVGTLALRGWGSDACSEVTQEYTIAVLAAADASATCDATTKPATVKPADTGSASGSSSATTKPNTPVSPQADGSKTSGADNVDDCSATRGTVRTRTNGDKYCECLGDWRNPPMCDEYSWTKTILTILGAVATVLSIAFSVRAYIKSKKTEKENQDRDLDVASENELETMRISPAKRDTVAASPATTVSLNSTRRTPVQTPLTATPIRTSGHETTL